MGAAWVLRSDFCSILTKDMDFEQMNGVIDGRLISIKVDAEDAASRLNELYEKLQGIFNLTPLERNQWERKRNGFLKIVNNLECNE